MEKCVIFGASKSGITAYGLLCENYDIIGFADNDSKKWGKKICDITVFCPEKLHELPDVKIIIASVYYPLINRQLRDMGISDIWIFYYMGQAAYGNSREYRLYKIQDTTLFEKCVYDEELITEISKDFSKNYNLDSVSDKRILPDTDRKKVLFCAYIFPPLGGSGVQRSLKFVKYLRKYGYEPIVLTVGENDGKIIQDSTLLAELPEDITIVRIDSEIAIPECLSEETQQELYNLYCGISKNKTWMEEYLKIIRDHDGRLIPDNKIVWVNECLKQIEQIIDLNEIDVIYTTGNPYSDYILGYYIKNKYGIKWVQDYRDPWTTNQYYLDEFYDMALTEKLQSEMERNLAENADAIIVLADALADDFVNKFKTDRSRIKIITNGYDEADFKDIFPCKNRNDKFTLCYNGTIYINRSPIDVLNALNMLIEEGHIDKNEIQWIFNGVVEDKWKKKISEIDLYNIVVYNGSLIHGESIKSAVNSDLLVLFGATGEGAKVVHTGKVFEYLRMKRPILSLSEPGGLLDSMMNETNAGQNFSYDDIEGIKNYILKKYNEWRNNTSASDIRDEKIQKYSREYATGLLSVVFDDIID